MIRYGLIGYPLEHSFSRDYFTKKFKRERINAVYNNFPVKSLDKLPGILKEYPDLAGLNVTLPYKSSIIKYLDDIEPRAMKAGAVNVISISGEGRKKTLCGYITDIDGFILSLKPLLNTDIEFALVLGTGGASKAVQAGLDEMGIAYIVVSRDSSKADMTYLDLTGDLIKKCGLLINATPLGMFPETDKAPDIPYDSLGSKCILFDLVYNPERSLFLRLGKERGCHVKNGLEMLFIQAEKAWDIWKE